MDISLSIKEAYRYITEFVSDGGILHFLIVVISLLLIIDAFTSFRYYYIKKFYRYSLRTLDLRSLKYKRDIVISAYKMLATQDSIEKALKVVRELEDKLEVSPMDFSKYKSQYLKDIKNVSDRGYY
jgi:hypothetical protein